MMLRVVLFLLGCFSLSNSQGYDGRYIGSYIQPILPKANESELPEWFTNLPGYECSQKLAWPGEERFAFPCLPLAKSASKPTSVHYLRPGDIDVIGALGDSLSAANGADACFLPEIAYMYRGRCFSSGADGSYASNPTLANILLKYNPDLKGYSLRTNWWTAPEAGFNVAIPGAVADDMPEQARAIIWKMKEDMDNFEKDWKLVTLFIGGNDLCGWCDSNGNEKPNRTPEAFSGYIEEALKILYDGMPRAFINVVSVLQVHQVYKMTGSPCDAFHNAWCSAGMDFPEETLAQTRKYNVAVRNMVDQKFNGKEDFTVVVQPFLEETILPELPNGEADFSYFAPDCFHFSSKGHAVAGKELWNNMNQKVGEKTVSWNPSMSDVVCPTEEFPYLRTKWNSMNPPGDFASRPSALSSVTLLIAFLTAAFSFSF